MGRVLTSPVTKPGFKLGSKIDSYQFTHTHLNIQAYTYKNIHIGSDQMGIILEVIQKIDKSKRAFKKGEFVIKKLKESFLNCRLQYYGRL